ncbi:hypothetical protein SELMODRAFT_417940 [Selaginella moellendorffii]|uniref:Uncharacterized protein n=1 Tax=Selaginella moellendorffii TaxID=88036 RepID=D8S457_SELML|nr:hypothetical protein SELMODRAFT_417940 [Selaginella moellendorffii]
MALPRTKCSWAGAPSLYSCQSNVICLILSSFSPAPDCASCHRDRAEIELRVEDHSIRLKREIVIEIPKKELISKLCSSIIGQAHLDDFLLLCDKLEQITALQYRSRQENLTDVYELFNSVGNVKKLESFSEAQTSSQAMDKSNFKALSTQELKVATSS